jgi:stringent starvation protein B
MLVQRPYLLKAFYNWIVDSECTPHIIVDATLANVEVPEKFVEDGKIVLNIAPRSVMQFSMDDNAIVFNARFSGQPMQVYVPIYAIEGIYARENNEGIMFPEEPKYKTSEVSVEVATETVAKIPASTNKPGLKLVE